MKFFLSINCLKKFLNTTFPYIYEECHIITSYYILEYKKKLERNLPFYYIFNKQLYPKLKLQNTVQLWKIIYHLL